MTDTDSSIADRYCRAFLTPADRAWATHELAALGAAAIPVLRSILSGEAKNEFGIAYRCLGMPVDCALATIQLLRTTARPLEDFIRAEMAAGHRYAEDALRAIMAADPPSD
jgi:hypothetical protein